MGRARRPWSRRRWVIATVLLVLVCAFSIATARLFVWPSLPPLPEQADAIVQLGGPGNRESTALALARDGLAPMLVQSTYAEDLIDDGECLPPVPDVVTLCFHPDPNTTRGEAQAIARFAEEYGWRSIILVTTPDQAWRASVRVSRCFDGDIFVATTPLPHRLLWLRQIPYQWGATAKAFTVETDC